MVETGSQKLHSPLRMSVKGERGVLVARCEEGELARDLSLRLFEACGGFAPETRLLDAGELPRLPEEWVRGATVLAVGPEKVRGLEGFGRRISVPCGEDASPEDFDAVFEIGLSPPEKENGRHFVFGGPTEREAGVISGASPAGRLPWAVVGEQTPRYAALVAGLVGELDPGGFVFLPDPGMAGEGGLSLGQESLEAVLSKTGLYIWLSGEHPPCFDACTYAKALRCGAVPVVVGEMPDVPYVFSSVASLREAVLDPGLDAMYDSAREFYLSGGTLEENLEEALESV